MTTLFMYTELLAQNCIFLIQIEDMHPSAMTNCHSLDEVDVQCSSATFNVGSSG